MHSHTDALTVEAGTAEQALSEISARLGPDAEILDARKVPKGGIAGFFAKELVQITARSRHDGETRAPFERVLETALAREEEAKAAVAVHDGMPKVLEPSAAPPQEPEAPASWRLTGSVDWSVTALSRHDLPWPMIDSVMGLDPRDDLGWIAAIAGAVAPWCRPLPGGSSIMVGPSAGRLGRALGIEVVDPSALAPYAGDFAASVTASDRGWVDTVRGERWLNLVVDGRSSAMGLLGEEVLAVSWVGSKGIASALRLASSLGLVLGYGMEGRHGAACRATPIDVALAVRDLVGRRR